MGEETSKTHLKNWLIKPVIATVIGGILLLVIQNVLPRFVPALGALSSAPTQNTPATPRDPFAFYSWSRQQVGYSRKWDFIFYEDFPLIVVQIKVAVVADQPQTVDLYLPVRGQVINYTVPQGVKTDDSIKRNALCITLKDLKPGTVASFSLSIRHEYGDEPFDPKSFVVFGGRSDLLGWDEFDSTVQMKQKGFWNWLMQ